MNSAKKMADDVSMGIQKGVDQTTAAFDNINAQVTRRTRASGMLTSRGETLDSGSEQLEGPSV